MFVFLTYHSHGSHCCVSYGQNTNPAVLFLSQSSYDHQIWFSPISSVPRGTVVIIHNNQEQFCISPMCSLPRCPVLSGFSAIVTLLCLSRKFKCTLFTSSLCKHPFFENIWNFCSVALEPVLVFTFVTYLDFKLRGLSAFSSGQCSLNDSVLFSLLQGQIRYVITLSATFSYLKHKKLQVRHSRPPSVQSFLKGQRHEMDIFYEGINICTSAFCVCADGF